MANQKKATTKSKAAVQEQVQADEWLTTREACELLGVSRPTLLRLAKKHKWTVNQVYTVNGSENRYRMAELAEYSQRGVKREQVVLGGINALQRGQVVGELTDIRQDVQGIHTELGRLATAQERANELKERELALQERRLELETRQLTSSASPRPEHAQEQPTGQAVKPDISISGEAAAPMPPAGPPERDVWQRMIEILEWLLAKLNEWR